MAWRALTAGLVSVLLLAGCGDSGSGDADADVDGDADTDADADTDTDTDTTPFCDEITCGAATLCAVPADPAARGPWTVGARTADVGGLTTEGWYPQ